MPMNWKHVCDVGDVTVDSVKKFNIEGIDIVLINLGDEFRALPPLCPHMEEQLAESGVCAGGTLTCTKHLWQWDLRTGEQQGPAEKPLLMYDVQLDDGKVMVSMDKELVYDFDEEDDDDFEW